jgi:hypothetical protein
VDVPRRGWRLVAGVVVMLLALVVVGRLQGGNLPGSDAGVPRAVSTTVADATPVASGLAVAGRVALPGQPAAVAVGEGAVWVLLEQGTLLRVDPDRHRVTGRLELETPTDGMPLGPWDVRVGPLAVGAGAVWVGTRRGTVTVRVDPVRLRVAARFAGNAVVVAHGVLWSYCCRRGDKVMGFGRVDARTLRHRRPLVVSDAAGRRQPVGRWPWAPTRCGPCRWRAGGCGGCRWRAARPVPCGWPASPPGSRPTAARCGCCRGPVRPAAGPTKPAGYGAWTSTPVRSPRPRRCRTWLFASLTSGSGWWLAMARYGRPARTRAGFPAAASCYRSIPPLGG